MISGTALKKQLSAADVEQHQGILARAGRYLGQALSMPVGLLDMADVCVYGQPNIINETFIDAAQQYLDAATSSSFHKLHLREMSPARSSARLQDAAL